MPGASMLDVLLARHGSVLRLLFLWDIQKQRYTLNRGIDCALSFELPSLLPSSIADWYW